MAPLCEADGPPRQRDNPVRHRAVAQARAWDSKLDDHAATGQDFHGVDVNQISAQSNWG